MATQQYVVALRREDRAGAPDDWAQQLDAIDGVSVIGSTPRRAQVAADDAGIARLRKTVGSEMLIEPVVRHYTQGQGDATEPGAS